MKQITQSTLISGKIECLKSTCFGFQPPEAVVQQGLQGMENTFQIFPKGFSWFSCPAQLHSIVICRILSTEIVYIFGISFNARISHFLKEDEHFDNYLNVWKEIRISIVIEQMSVDTDCGVFCPILIYVFHLWHG